MRSSRSDVPLLTTCRTEARCVRALRRIGASIFRACADRLCCNSSPGAPWVESRANIRLDGGSWHDGGTWRWWSRKESRLVVKMKVAPPLENVVQCGSRAWQNGPVHFGLRHKCTSMSNITRVVNITIIHGFQSSWSWPQRFFQRCHLIRPVCTSWPATPH